MDKGRGLVFFLRELPQMSFIFFNSTIFPLKVVSAMFLLVCLLCLKESTCETRKMFFISL